MPPFRRRSRASRSGRPSAAPADAPTAAPTQTPVPADRSTALRAPTPLHAFNRYELKYLVPESRVPEVREHLRQRMDADRHAHRGGYDVISLYYDSIALRFYWEKIEGLRFRRKLRIRHYGDRSTITDDSPVYVEIKQRVNRVTQKRRVGMPYHLARRLCDGREEIPHDPRQRAFLDEVLGLIVENDLRPIATTAYQREPFVGRGIDLGLRVTLDHRVRGRDRDFHLGADAEDRFTIPPHLAVMEIKADERVPYWVTDLTAALNLQVVRISKYCQTIEAFGKAPRSAFHIPEDLDLEAPTTAVPRSAAPS
ncbi:VTC domain-containing protein [Pseudonocardia thermophila]|jgi:SPX domain-containing protein involved in vacuolar polyphosphate accumulation|uniref:VTC domain-containing protein n=1 Tax=Pseudonocardia thermophila TaxID=1848 RepID=A0A1M6U016_PSETH|nr:polyphosphate polymerase domain-containing protein [Pseudonocardia thermophila]SHK62428.1 VTC domain-containing protein [Pseudonocardia thermophila]